MRLSADLPTDVQCNCTHGLYKILVLNRHAHYVQLHVDTGFHDNGAAVKLPLLPFHST